LKLIVGLGNPGEPYKYTRHNAGFLVIDHFLKINTLSLSKKDKFYGEIGIFNQNNQSYILLKPNTYMNKSGESIRVVMEYYNIQKEDLLIFVDDVYMDFNTIRIREKGGHGGQNGLRNIIDHLQTQDFKRVRIGIGKDEKMPLDQYVLSKFKPTELNTLENTLITCSIIISKFIDNIPFVDIMTQFNKK
jgi:PTH1 family peptidyl-tRNA hydrolase